MTMMKTEKRQRQTYKRWTTKEEDFLEKHIEILPVPLIAAKLKRSVLSVEAKADRMGYGVTPVLDCFSARFLALNSGLHPSTLQLWLRQGFLEAEKESPGKWAIKISDFKRFVHKYPEKAEKIDPDFLEWVNSN